MLSCSAETVHCARGREDYSEEGGGCLVAPRSMHAGGLTYLPEIDLPCFDWQPGLPRRGDDRHYLNHPRARVRCSASTAAILKPARLRSAARTFIHGSFGGMRDA